MTKESLTFSESEAQFIGQFENALQAQDKLMELKADRVTVTIREHGKQVMSTFDKQSLLWGARRMAETRYQTLKWLGLEMVAADIVDYRAYSANKDDISTRLLASVDLGEKK